MAKYILLYKSNTASDWSKLPEQEVKKVMDAWGEWVGSMGSDRKDGDAFKFGGKSVTKDGPKDADNLLTGYTVFEGTYEEALKKAQEAPNVKAGIGTIEVYEAFGF